MRPSPSAILVHLFFLDFALILIAYLIFEFITIKIFNYNKLMHLDACTHTCLQTLVLASLINKITTKLMEEILVE